MATPFRVRGADRNPRTNTKGRNGGGNPRTRFGSRDNFDYIFLFQREAREIIRISDIMNITLMLSNIQLYRLIQVYFKPFHILLFVEIL